VPAATLHITFAELLADAAVPQPVAHAIRARPRYARLGAMLHDLPYYGNMVVAAIRYGLNRPTAYNEWGKRIHVDGSAAPILAHLVARLHGVTDVSGDARLALLAGAVSHLALDAALHDLVRFCAQREMQTQGGDEDFHHKKTEKLHSLFFHFERFGRDLLGHPSWLDRTRLMPEASLWRRRHRPALTEAWLGAIADHYGGAPSVTEWTAWLRNFVHFGFLTSGYLTRRNSRIHATDELRRVYYTNDLFHFPDHFAAATKLAERSIGIVYRYFVTGHFDAAARAKLVVDLALPPNLGWPNATDPPHPYVVPPPPAPARSAATDCPLAAARM
jgi:hypothetical protein